MSSLSTHDPFDLQRFVKAQENTYEQALAEIRSGRKESHWMWFIFPQLRGLGRSAMSQHYGISGREEARAYLDHEVLGPRLTDIAEAVLAVSGRTATEIFGQPDDMKLRSSATLFAHVASPDSVFSRILDRYFSGNADQSTLELLNAE